MLNRVAEEAEKLACKSTQKTVIISANNKRAYPVQLHQENIKEVEKLFTWAASLAK
jgi:hypothetical protein